MSTLRRLAADVVGYSRLVSAAEADALARSDTPDVKSSSDAVTSVYGTFRTSQPDSGMSVVGGRAEVVIASPDFRVGPTGDIWSRN
jgi:hypothetical protein